MRDVVEWTVLNVVLSPVLNFPCGSCRWILLRHSSTSHFLQCVMLLNGRAERCSQSSAQLPL